MALQEKMDSLVDQASQAKTDGLAIPVYQEVLVSQVDLEKMDLMELPGLLDVQVVQALLGRREDLVLKV